MLLSMLAPPGAPNPEDLVKLYAGGSKMNYCIVQNGVVVNVIDWDGVTPYTPPEGCELYRWEGPVGIGWLWVDGHPVDPNPRPRPLAVVVDPAKAAESGGPTVL